MTISVQDRPDPVTGAQVTGFGDGTLDVAFGAGRIQQLADHRVRDRTRRPERAARCSTTSTCAATTCTVPTPGNGQANAVLVRVQAPQRDRALRPRRGAGSDLVRRDPATAAGPPGAAARRTAPHRVGARRHGCGQPGRVVRGHGRRRLERGRRRRGVHGDRVRAPSRRASRTAARCRSRVSARNQAYPALATWTEAGGTGTPFGPPIAGGITRHGRRRGRRGHGVVGAVRRQRRRHRRLLRAAPRRRRRPRVPTGPQACSVTSPAPGDVVAPASGGSVAEVVQVGPDASSVQFTGHRHRVDALLLRRLGLQPGRPASNTEVAGIVVRPAPGAVTGVQSGMAWMNQETWDRYIDRGRRRGGPRMQIVAVDANGAQIGQPAEFRGTGWLRDPARTAPFGETARFQVRSCSVWGSCGPWSAVMPSTATPSLTFALPSRVWDEPSRTWSWTAAARQLRAAGDLPLRRRGQRRQPGRAVGDDVPDPERQGRRTGLVGC